MKRKAFIFIGVASVIMVSGLEALTSYATISGVTLYYQETQARPAVYAASVIQNMGNWENTDSIWKFRLKEGDYLKYSWIQSTINENDFYFLSSDGIMLTNTTTPDGYVVDAAGIWTYNHKEIQKQLDEMKNTEPNTEASAEVRKIQDYYDEQIERDSHNQELIDEVRSYNQY